MVSTETGLRDYEMVVIFSPQLDDDRAGAAVENISKFVTGKGGTIDEVQRWGKKRLAYPIKHAVEGHYVLYKMKMLAGTGKELESNLAISEDVLRHMLIRLES